MSILKFFGTAVAVTLGLFIVVMNFSATDSRFKCNGDLSAKDDTTKPASIYIKLEKYRWWVGLWSDSSGSVWLEVPNSWSDYYDRVEEAGENLIIRDSYEKRTKGNFSKLSKTLAIETTVGYFVGTCESNDK